MADPVLSISKSSANKHKYLLLQSQNYSSVLSPLKCTQRIKYTCFDISQSFLLFGATSGGLYVFRREPCSFLQLLPNKEGAVCKVSISPDEKLIAFASVRGVVCVLSRSESGGCATRCLNRSVEHNGSEVTALCWVATSDQLFVGDKQGRLSVINVPIFMSKNIFNVPAFVFMQLDSGVVQVCSHGERLLVSTLTRCYVCDTEKEQYRQVGSKLREGEYGACYFGKDQVKIFCARPGSRLWEVDDDGVVKSTHQFKQALAKQPSFLVQNSGENNNIIFSELSESSWPEQSFNFAKLSVFLDKYLFTFKQDGIYIFDPEEVDVVLWSNCFQDIMDAKCFEDIVYIFTSNSEIHALAVLTIEKCLLKLYFQKEYELCSDLCLKLASTLMQSTAMMSKLSPLLGLKSHISNYGHDLLILFDQIEKYSREKENALQLDSGIFLIENHHLCLKQLNDQNDETLNSEKQKTKSIRSQSLPPGMQQIQKPISNRSDFPKNNISASTNSLPELVTSSETFENSYFQGNSNEFLSPFHIHSVPLLPVSSPDIIHDALVEIGMNMSGKLANGTKTLRDKLQVLEEKLNISKNDNNKALNTKVTEEMTIDQNVESEEVIVNNQKFIKNKEHSILSTYITELVNLCLEHKNNSAESNLLDEIISTVLKLLGEYNKIIVNKGLQPVNSFPFKRFLTENSILNLCKVFHDSFKTGVIVHWLNNGKTILSSELNVNTYPNILQSIYSEDSLKLDFNLSIVLTIFSEILDPDTILKCLDLLSFQCIYLSWCVVLNRFQEGTLRHVTQSSENGNVGCTEWPAPLLLNAIFLSFRLEQVDACFRMAMEGCVSLRIISYTLLKLADHLEETGMTKTEAVERSDKLLLGYVSKMMEKNLEIDLQDKVLQAHLESAFMNINSKSDYSVCHCFFPLPGSGLSNAKYNAIGKKLITFYWELYTQKVPNGVKPDLLLSHDSDDNKFYHSSKDKNDTMFLQFLQKNELIGNDIQHLSMLESEYLKNILQLCCVSSSLLLWALQKAPNCGQNLSLTLVVQLGLVFEMKQYIESNNSLEWWENVFHMNSLVKRGCCCACGSEWGPNRDAGFQWIYLATITLEVFGPTTTLNLIKRFSSEILPGELDRRFYQSCILTNIVDNHTSGLRKKVLDIIIKVNDSGKNKAAMSEEIGVKVNTALESDLCTASHNKFSGTNHHWGMTVDLKNGDCALCSLNLGAPRLVKDGGIRGFMCDHTFHNVCLQVAHSLFFCPLCCH